MTTTAQEQPTLTDAAVITAGAAAGQDDRLHPSVPRVLKSLV